MFVDNALSFNGGWNSSQSVTATANGTNLIDVTGAGSGSAPSMINGFPAANTAIGFDYGVGDGMAVPYLMVNFKSVGSSSNTVTISLAAAPDNGSYSPGTYTTIYTSPALTENTLVAGSTLLVPVPPTFFELSDEGTNNEALPRFYRITYTCSSSVTLTVNAGFIINPNSALIGNQYQANFIAG